MLIKLYAVVAVLAETLICLFTDIIDSWTDFWIPIVMALGIFLALVAVTLLILVIISWFVDKDKPCEKPEPFFKRTIEIVVDSVLFVAGVHTTMVGLEKVPTDRRFLLVCNHRCGLDPLPVLVKMRRYNVAFVSKPENFNLPIVGSFVHKSCCLPIDRENARKAMKTIHQATEYVKNDITSIGIYPEGTRSKTGELLEFKDGVFYIAKKAKCPIVVMTAENTEKIGKNFPWRRTKVIYTVLDVVEPESFENQSTHEISENVRNMMLAHLGK